MFILTGTFQKHQSTFFIYQFLNPSLLMNALSEPQFKNYILSHMVTSSVNMPYMYSFRVVNQIMTEQIVNLWKQLHPSNMRQPHQE